MRICNSETLKNHFENLVDVKLFTPAMICTIIDTLSVEVPDGTEIIWPGRGRGSRQTREELRRLMNRKPDIVGGGQRYDD